MERNDYQNSFLHYIADLQKECVEIAMCRHKLYESEDCEKVRELLYDITFEMIVEIMEMIDGYSTFTSDKLDIINTKTGQRLKQDPFIELHDAICEYIKYE